MKPGNGIVYKGVVLNLVTKFVYRRMKLLILLDIIRFYKLTKIPHSKRQTKIVKRLLNFTVSLTIIHLNDINTWVWSHKYGDAGINNTIAMN